MSDIFGIIWKRTMSDIFAIIICLFVGFGIGTLVGLTHGSYLTYEAVMKEAYDRGHAVQCLGKEGYYWECEE